MEDTIREIKNRNFENNGNQNKYQELKTNFPDQLYTCIPFTSLRCEKVASILFRLVKTYTPAYNLNIAW